MSSRPASSHGAYTAVRAGSTCGAMLLQPDVENGPSPRCRTMGRYARGRRPRRRLPPGWTRYLRGSTRCRRSMGGRPPNSAGMTYFYGGRAASWLIIGTKRCARTARHGRSLHAATSLTTGGTRREGAVVLRVPDLRRRAACGRHHLSHRRATGARRRRHQHHTPASSASQTGLTCALWTRLRAQRVLADRDRPFLRMRAFALGSATGGMRSR